MVYTPVKFHPNWPSSYNTNATTVLTVSGNNNNDIQQKFAACLSRLQPIIYCQHRLYDALPKRITYRSVILYIICVHCATNALMPVL
jgi:hypothetical protein